MTTDRTPRPANRTPSAGLVPHYEIRVEGHLHPRWEAWFDGMALRSERDGTTVIRGPVVDQAALHGLLQRLRDIGIPLLSLVELPLDAPAATADLVGETPPNTPPNNPPGATS